MEETPPVIVSTPNVTQEKMAAIVSLSKAVETLALALASTNTTVNISDCTIKGAETGISVEG